MARVLEGRRVCVKRALISEHVFILGESNTFLVFFSSLDLESIAELLYAQTRATKKATRLEYPRAVPRLMFAGTAILVLGMERVQWAIVTIREYGFLSFGYGAVAICRHSIWFGWARVVLPSSISS